MFAPSRRFFNTSLGERSAETADWRDKILKEGRTTCLFDFMRWHWCRIGKHRLGSESRLSTRLSDTSGHYHRAAATRRRHRHISRIIGEQLSKQLGQPFVIENWTGAGTVVGTAAAATAAPDGYTLLAGLNSNMAVNPSLFAKLSYDPIRDFTPVGMLAEFRSSSW